MSQMNCLSFHHAHKNRWKTDTTQQSHPCVHTDWHCVTCRSQYFLRVTTCLHAMLPIGGKKTRLEREQGTHFIRREGK